MKKRIIAISTAIAIIVLVLFIVKSLPAKTAPEATSKAPKATLIDVIYPKAGEVAYELTSTGKLTAVERFEIFSQVDGQLLASAQLFKEGKKYQKGEVMLAVDAQEYKMTLLAAKSDFITLLTSILPDLKSDYPEAYTQWRQYVLDIDVNKQLPTMPEPNDSQEKFFLSGKGVYSSYYNIQSGEEKFAKYTIKAPFNGIVTSSQVVAGKAVRPGTELGAFINPEVYDLEVTLPLTAMRDIEPGTEAVLNSTEIKGEWTGKVIRIGGDIDELSQSVKVFIRTRGTNLKEGMFLTANISLNPFANAISLPRKMLNDQNQLFVVKDGKLQRKQVTVLMRQGDLAIVEGLNSDEPVLSTVIKNAYEGMPVVISEQ